ncbi:hypothetical protein [Spiroplasma endosymbiont of Seladonia tumulorum]|uniref:hypothetical protein n=1 Tax=Spiroplasma endosymbiont of Seladonia tumulorum TaxID=3066321 RepID=UPI0030D2CC45
MAIALIPCHVFGWTRFVLTASIPLSPFAAKISKILPINKVGFKLSKLFTLLWLISPPKNSTSNDNLYLLSVSL